MPDKLKKQGRQTTLRAALIDRLIDPESVAGVEIFPSSAGVPTQYAGIDATCGVILFWTRR